MEIRQSIRDNAFLAISLMAGAAGVVLGTSVYDEHYKKLSTTKDLSFLDTSEVSYEDINGDDIKDIVITSEGKEFVYYGIGDNNFMSKWKILEGKESELETETKRELQKLNTLYSPKQTSE